MRKLAIALAAVIGMTTVAHADWNGPRHHHHYYRGGSGGGDAGAALFGGLVGGLIIGGMVNQMNQPRAYYQQPYYEPMCREVVVNRYWNGWQWVYRTATVCD
jgi:MFS family permease